MKTGRSDDFTIPPALLTEIQAAADHERRPAVDVLRDVIEHGLEKRRWRTHAGKDRQRGRALGLPDDDISLTDAYRQVLHERIAQGVQSLREGRVIDGETFMARMDAELAALEQQERR